FRINFNSLDITSFPMQRRNFLMNIGTGSLALSLTSILPAASLLPDKSGFQKIIPARLKQGDTIGIVSPSSAIFETEPYEIAVETFEAMGLKVKLGEFVNNRYGHLAGTDEERAGELNAMFKDPGVQAIIALRGGSGAARILDKLDYKVIAANPKIFIGYSD